MFPNKHKAVAALFAAKPDSSGGGDDMGGGDMPDMDSDPDAGGMKAAEDLMEAIKMGDAKAVLQAAKDIFMLADAEPHDEGQHPDMGGDGGGDGMPAMARGGMVGDRDTPRMPRWPSARPSRRMPGGGDMPAMPKWPMRPRPFNMKG